MNKEAFVSWVYPQAKRVGGISPYFTTAQAALESGWGSSAIGNNLFGITKGSTWSGKTKLVLTHEYFSSTKVKFNAPEKIIGIECKGCNKYKYTVYCLFRDYDSLSDCLSDHQVILKKPQFRDAWPYRQHPIAYTQHIVDCVGGKYATDPNYVRTMMCIINEVERIVKELGL